MSERREIRVCLSEQTEEIGFTSIALILTVLRWWSAALWTASSCRMTGAAIQSSRGATPALSVHPDQAALLLIVAP